MMKMQKIFEFIEAVANLSSIYPNEKLVREFIVKQLTLMKRKYKIDKEGNLYLLPKTNSKSLLSAHMDKQAEPYYEDLGETIQGKLDDAIGIGIILALTKTYDFYAFLSIEEEKGLQGSIYALNNGLIPKVENAIIIDTSPFGELGNGPIFYTSFANRNPSDDFLNIIFNLAESMKLNLQPMDGWINDGINIIRAIPDTIALEPHIDNYHTSEEISAKKDIMDTCRIIEQFLKTKWNF